MQLRFLHKVMLILLACAVLLAPLQNRLLAQESRGTIVGKVSDPSGAVVPGATVTVVNRSMGTKVTLTTNESGSYQASFLIPGGYEITAEQAGF